MDAFEQGNTSTEVYEHHDHDQQRVRMRMEFFHEVEHDEALTRWTRLSVASRCQKSDFHHYRLKGQWLVRDALELIFGEVGLEEGVKEVLARYVSA